MINKENIKTSCYTIGSKIFTAPKGEAVSSQSEASTYSKNSLSIIDNPPDQENNERSSEIRLDNWKLREPRMNPMLPDPGPGRFYVNDQQDCGCGDCPTPDPTPTSTNASPTPTPTPNNNKKCFRDYVATPDCSVNPPSWKINTIRNFCGNNDENLILNSWNLTPNNECSYTYRVTNDHACLYDSDCGVKVVDGGGVCCHVGWSFIRSKWIFSCLSTDPIISIPPIPPGDIESFRPGSSIFLEEQCSPMNAFEAGREWKNSCEECFPGYVYPEAYKFDDPPLSIPSEIPSELCCEVTPTPTPTPTPIFVTPTPIITQTITLTSVTPTPTPTACNDSGWTYFICTNNGVVEYVNNSNDDLTNIVAAVDTETYNSNSIRILEFLRQIHCNSWIISNPKPQTGYYNCGSNLMSSSEYPKTRKDISIILREKIDNKCLKDTDIKFLFPENIEIPIGVGVSYSPNLGYVCTEDGVEAVIKPCYTGSDDDVCWGFDDGLTVEIAELACKLRGRIACIDGDCKIINTMNCTLADSIARKYTPVDDPIAGIDYRQFNTEALNNMINQYSYPPNASGLQACYDNCTPNPTPTPTTTPTTTPTVTPTVTVTSSPYLKNMCCYCGRYFTVDIQTSYTGPGVPASDGCDKDVSCASSISVGPTNNKRDFDFSRRPFGLAAGTCYYELKDPLPTDPPPEELLPREVRPCYLGLPFDKVDYYNLIIKSFGEGLTCAEASYIDDNAEAFRYEIYPGITTQVLYSNGGEESFCRQNISESECTSCADSESMSELGKLCGQYYADQPIGVSCLSPASWVYGEEPNICFG